MAAVHLGVLHKHQRMKKHHDTEEKDAKQPLATRAVQNHIKESVQIIDHSRHVTGHLWLSAKLWSSAHETLRCCPKCRQTQNQRNVASLQDCSAKGSRVEEIHAAPPRQSRNSKIYAALPQQEQVLQEAHGHVYKLFVDSFRCVLVGWTSPPRQTFQKFEPLAHQRSVHRFRLRGE